MAKYMTYVIHKKAAQNGIDDTLYSIGGVGFSVFLGCWDLESNRRGEGCHAYFLGAPQQRKMNTISIKHFELFLVLKSEVQHDKNKFEPNNGREKAQNF